MFASSAARGDGGLVRLSEASGPFRVTMFTAPTPLLAGAIDVSVLVQDVESRAIVLDAAVEVTLRRLDAAAAVRRAPATRAAATNKLLYAALLDVPAPGRWGIDVQITADAGSTTVGCEIDVAPPRAPALLFWPYLALPFAAIALYALREWLRAKVGG